MRIIRTGVMFIFALSLATLGYAETQSVKISGEISERAFARNNYGLNHDDVETSTNGRSTSWDTFVQGAAEVQVDADLTDNVAGTVRLVNQRVWGDNSAQSNAAQRLGADVPFADTFAPAAVNGGANSTDIAVDLAYIELKEFLYSPLTLRIGRQDIWFGKGFVIGTNMQDPQGALLAPEWTCINSFDAIRATLDYNPWTIDGMSAKIGENYMRADDDVNLFGVNVGYVFDAYNAEAEAYWFMKQQRFTDSASAVTTVNVHNGVNSNDVHTLGMRGSVDPIEDWTLALEGAYQFGNYIGITNQENDRARSAWAIDASAECRYFQKMFAWKPVMLLEYIFYSGEENLGNKLASDNADYHGWDPIYRGKVDTDIREWQNVYYGTAMPSSPSSTNQHQVIAKGSIQPTDSLTCSAKYAAFWLAEVWAENTVGTTPENKKKFVGQEVDLETIWNYTEDVQFGLICAWFFPGDHFSSAAGCDTATDIVGSVKLTF